MECTAVNTEGNDSSAAFLEITDIAVSLISNADSNISDLNDCIYRVHSIFGDWMRRPKSLPAIIYL